jgi:hypothetical protein
MKIVYVKMDFHGVLQLWTSIFIQELLPEAFLAKAFPEWDLRYFLNPKGKSATTSRDRMRMFLTRSPFTM